MKKILILLAAICCYGCSGVETNATAATETTEIKYYRNDIGGHIYSVEIEGHIYIVASTSNGGSIIHAEHCSCKNK